LSEPALVPLPVEGGEVALRWCRRQRGEGGVGGRGVERLRAFGYEPVVMPHALARGPLYYAGTAEERVADLHAAFADKSIDGVICTRGGWGSAELLPLLDAELVRRIRRCLWATAITRRCIRGFGTSAGCRRSMRRWWRRTGRRRMVWMSGRGAPRLRVKV
jgi:hypothetical protein